MQGCKTEESMFSDKCPNGVSFVWARKILEIHRISKTGHMPHVKAVMALCQVHIVIVHIVIISKAAKW